MLGPDRAGEAQRLVCMLCNLVVLCITTSSIYLSVLSECIFF